MYNQPHVPREQAGHRSRLRCRRPTAARSCYRGPCRRRARRTASPSRRSARTPAAWHTQPSGGHPLCGGAFPEPAQRKKQQFINPLLHPTVLNSSQETSLLQSLHADN